MMDEASRKANKPTGADVLARHGRSAAFVYMRAAAAARGQRGGSIIHELRGLSRAIHQAALTG